jgi:hypothetical protein
MKKYGGVDVFLTSALIGGEWSTSCPDRFTPGEKPLDRRLGGPQNQSGRRRQKENLDSTETWTPTPRSSSPVSSRYTDWTIPAPQIK